MKDEIPGSQHAALDLHYRCVRVGSIASEDENISPRQGARLVSRKRIIAEEHAPHSQTHVIIIAGVGYEIDPDLATQTLGQATSGIRNSENLTHPIEEAGRLFRPHPIAHVEVIACCGNSHEMLEVTDQSIRAEPADRNRRVRAAVEMDETGWFSPRLERLRVGSELGVLFVICMLVQSAHRWLQL